MKSIIIITVIAAIAVSEIGAQTGTRERLDAYKVAFFTKRLNLTPVEAEKFWPLYNEFQNKRGVIQQERAAINRNFNENELNMSDKEMIDAADRLIALEVQEAAIAQEYNRKFREILSPVKVLRLYQAENQYRMQLLQELRQNQEMRNNLRKGPGQGVVNNPL
jgi:hypothetical protein